MKYLLLFIIFISFSISAKSQSIIDSTVYIISNFKPLPEFPGGFDSLKSFIKKEFNWNNVSGQLDGIVLVQFIVDEKGMVLEPRVLKSISVDYDTEAIRVIKNLPDWKPTLQNGRAVKVALSYPIQFSSF